MAIEDLPLPRHTGLLARGVNWIGGRMASQSIALLCGYARTEPQSTDNDFHFLCSVRFQPRNACFRLGKCILFGIEDLTGISV